MSNLPPPETPDLRDPNNRRNRESGDQKGWDQPQGGNQYRSQPQQQPQQEGWQQPPAGNQYPPQNPQGGNQYPPQQNWQQPQGGNQYQQQSGQYQAQQNWQQPQSNNLPGTGPLGGYQPPQLGGNNYVPPSSSTGNTGSLGNNTEAKQLGSIGAEMRSAFDERRIEYLSWGLFVTLGGIALLLWATGGEDIREILWVAVPIIGGGIMMVSGFLQRIIGGFHVSLLTWGVAIIGTSLGLTNIIALATDQTGFDNIASQLLYMIGLMIIISGMVIMLQIFRRPNE